MCTYNDIDITNMLENEYNELMKESTFQNFLLYYIIKNAHDMYEHIKKIYRWDATKECKNIERACVNIIAQNLSRSKSDDMLEEIITSKQIYHHLLIDNVITAIQSYPMAKFVNYFNLIIMHYNLQKIFDDEYWELNLDIYSLDTLRMMVDNGLRLNFEHVLINYEPGGHLVDAMCYIIDNLDMENLSKRALISIYSSNELLQIVISRAQIDFSSLDPLLLLGKMDEDKFAILSEHGYNFEEMLTKSIHDHKKNAIATEHAATAKSVWITKFLGEMHLGETILTDMLCSSIKYNHFVDACVTEHINRLNTDYDEQLDYNKQFFC